MVTGGGLRQRCSSSSDIGAEPVLRHRGHRQESKKVSKLRNRLERCTLRCPTHGYARSRRPRSQATPHSPGHEQRELAAGTPGKALLTGAALQRRVPGARRKNKPYNKLLVPVAAAPHARTPICWAVFRFRGGSSFPKGDPRVPREGQNHSG